MTDRLETTNHKALAVRVACMACILTVGVLLGTFSQVAQAHGATVADTMRIGFSGMAMGYAAAIIWAIGWKWR